MTARLMAGGKARSAKVDLKSVWATGGINSFRTWLKNIEDSKAIPAGRLDTAKTTGPVPCKSSLALSSFIS
jgi:hypothetical protein